MTTIHAVDKAMTIINRLTSAAADIAENTLPSTIITPEVADRVLNQARNSIIVPIFRGVSDLVRAPTLKENDEGTKRNGIGSQGAADGDKSNHPGASANAKRATHIT